MGSSQVEVKSGPAASRQRSIGEVARLFGLNASTLRYWEAEGLIVPASRESGRRLYDHENLRRIALIVNARGTGLMELAEIQTLLDGSTAVSTWRQAVQSRLETIRRKQEQLATAQSYLEHFLECPSEHPARTCSHLAAEIDRFLESLEPDGGRQA